MNDKTEVAAFSPESLTFRPVTPDAWDDFEAIFSEHGAQNGCWCVFWRITRSEYREQFGEGNKQTMRRIVEAERVPGILAYLGERPIGWCSIAPRGEFGSLNRSWTLKRVDDAPVWSIVCFFVSRPYRRHGASRALIEAAIDRARSNGARIVEAYPLIDPGAANVTDEGYMGLLSTYKTLGFREVARRSERRAVVRFTIDGDCAAGRRASASCEGPGSFAR